MSRLVSNYSLNGNTESDEYGTLFGVSDLIGNGGVIKGMAVAANTSPAMNVYVQTGSAAIPTGTAPSNYSYFVKIDTSGQGEQVTIATAASSPRIDYIVAYVNKGQAGSTAVTNNTNNVFLLADVPGTPASSPSVPTVSQIQSVIGAANPYIILGQVAVAANATQITTPNITDVRQFAGVGWQNITPNTREFRVKLAANVTLSTIATKLPFGGKDFGGSEIDTQTNAGRFTASVHGRYQFSTSVRTADVGRLAVYFYKNGATYSYGPEGWIPSGSAAGLDITHTDLIELNAGDYIEVYAGADTTRQAIASVTTFSGFLVRQLP